MMWFASIANTNICSAHLRRPGGLAHRFVQIAGNLAIPTVVLGKLLVGVYRHPTPKALLRGIEDLRLEVAILPFDEPCAWRFGEVRGALLKLGRPISAVDGMIAAVALVHDLTLVTHNVRHFEHVPGLRFEGWLAPR
jgi:tRNA(fMet)-specific endonuclease VapC